MGVERGDIVTIYMPQIPELPIAMLACAKIGAAHSVVYGGFSVEALAERIADANSRVLVTADGGYRRGSPSDLKGIANEAMIIMDENRMVEAIDLRPNDWRLREQMGVLRTSDTERYLGADQFDTSTELIKQQIENGADCISLRKQQLTYRESLLNDALNNCDDVFECNTTYLTQELEFVEERLAHINAGKSTAFCSGD